MGKILNDLYLGMEKQSFFRNESDRTLWVRLNAERIRHLKKLSGDDNTDLGTIDEIHSPIWISNNQLTYDEYMSDEPRFSLAELAGLSDDELFMLFEERNRDLLERLFHKTFKIDEDL